jgi:hypothetical protein
VYTLASDLQQAEDTMDERRKRRSDYKDLALESWLDAVAQRNTVPLLLVADGAGLLVASSRDFDDIDELAALSATLECRAGSVDSTVYMGVTMWASQVEGAPERLIVLSHGDETRVRAALQEAAIGITRILAEKARKA